MKHNSIIDVFNWPIAFVPLFILILTIISFRIVNDSFLDCRERTWCLPVEINNVLPNDTPFSVLDERTNTLQRDNLENRGIVATRYSGRFLWALLLGSYTMFGIAALLVSMQIVNGILSKKVGSNVIRNLIRIVIIVLPLLFFVLAYSLTLTPRAIIFALLSRTVILDMKNIADVMGVAVSFGYSITLCLVLSICVVLLPLKDTRYPDGLNEIYRRMKNLQLILYMATLLLVTTILVMQALGRWSLSFISNKDAAQVIDGLNGTIVAVQGGVYTFILASLYIPAAFILQARAHQLTGAPQNEIEKEKTLQEYGLGYSLSDALPRVVAIVGPLLAGPLSDLLTNLFK